ncbi:alpha/beta hydrolase [Iamia majanohamensis]|uniref:Alpha/beta hydrolase n=1 Tax=Iamia majanohamensis TaxID=467976 RepID=A0AAE9Y713_9ACTN|nr:alpha/beta hydrolase [Iamia majanohamensis]WCO66811.1 alpha/beta hydrolase [Iamia majanohamensis]
MTPIPTLSEDAATDLFRRPPDRHVDVGAGAVAVRRVGRGPDVLFVHGWPMSGATFRTLLPHLVDHVTCHVLDLPGAGDSRFGADTPLSIEDHIRTVGRVLDGLGLDDVAVVGHDSGGLIVRHGLVDDPRVRAFGLVDTEQPQGLAWRFRAFLAAGRLPGLAPALRWALARPRVRRHPLVLGAAFVDRSHLDGPLDELMIRPLVDDPARLDAAVRLLRGFDVRWVHDLARVHRRIEVPVQLVWGAHDAFFPVARAREMVGTFPDARLAVVADAGLFAHEERPEAVAEALLPVLTAS